MGGDAGFSPPPTTGGSGGGGSILPSWLTQNSNLLSTFAQHPRRLILGVLGSTLVGGVLNLWTQVLNFVHLLFFGSGTATPGSVMQQSVWGLADIPLAIAHDFADAVTALLSPFNIAPAAFTSWTNALLGGLGVFAWPVAVGVAVGVLVVLDRVLVDGGPLVLSGIPVVGSPLAASVTAIRGWL